MNREKNMTHRTVDYHGEVLTLAQLSACTGLSKDCLDRRYRQGDRGERLWRPLDSMKRSAGTHGAEATNIKREQQAAQHARIQTRQQRERQAQERARVERDAELGRALIAVELLSSEERREIHESVIGRQRWFSIGGLTR